MDSTYEQLVARNADLEAEKAALCELVDVQDAEIIALRKECAALRDDNVEIRRQLRTMRAA